MDDDAPDETEQDAQPLGTESDLQEQSFKVNDISSSCSDTEEFYHEIQNEENISGNFQLVLLL